MRRRIATLPASESRPCHEAGVWNRRKTGPHLSQLQADAALHRRVAGPWSVFHRDHSPRGGAADPGSHAGHHHRDARRVSGGGGATSNAAHRDIGAPNLRRRVCVLHVQPRSEPGDRALSGWHAAGRCPDQGLQQALLELRRYAAGSIAADHQGPLHRRCPDPGADVVGRALQRLSTSRHRGRDATQHRSGDRCLGDDDHRRASAQHARTAQHGEAQRVRPVADGHRRTSAGRQCNGAGGQLCGKQSGSPRGRREHLHPPRRFGSCCSGRCPRTAGVPARRCRADRRWPRRSDGLCGLRNNHRRRINATAISGSNHHRGQTQGHQRHRHR